VVDDLFEAAVLEEDVLVGLELVGCLAKLIGHGKYWGLLATIFDAGVAVGRDSHPQVSRPLGAQGEAQIRRHHNVALRRFHVNLDRAPIKRQQQRRSFDRALSCGEVQSGGGTYAHFPSTMERHIGRVVMRYYRGASDQHGAAVRYFERARDRRVLYADGPDGLLRSRSRR
jgi:hypothetical protein